MAQGVTAADTANYLRDCLAGRVTSIVENCEKNTRSSVTILDPISNRMTSPEIDFCIHQARNDTVQAKRILDECNLEAFKWADRQSLNSETIGPNTPAIDDEEIVLSDIPEEPITPPRPSCAGSSWAGSSWVCPEVATTPDPVVAPIPATRRRTADTPVVPTAPATPTGPTQAEVDAEVGQCLGLKQKASTCCGSPMSCSSELRSSDQNKLQQLMNAKAENSGTAGSAAQLSKLNGMSRDVNMGFAAVCSAHQGSCSTSCSRAAQKYQQLAQSCGEGCANHDLYTQAAQKLSTNSSSCNALQTKATNLVTQSVADTVDEEESDSIKSMASIEMPADLESDSRQQSKVDPCSKDPTSAACQTCTNNPSAPGCVQNSSFAQGQSGFMDPKSSKKGEDFNVPEVPYLNDSYISSITPPSGQQGDVNVVPNNSGGAIPGGNSSPAAPTPKGSAKYSASSNITDVWPGGFVAGGYSSSVDQNMARDIDGTRYKLGQRTQRSQTDGLTPYAVGMDLKRFLPGGKLDPNRRLAGVRGPGSEINGKGTDVWNKITEKMNERCRLGLLWKCQP